MQLTSSNVSACLNSLRKDGRPNWYILFSLHKSEMRKNETLPLWATGRYTSLSCSTSTKGRIRIKCNGLRGIMALCNGKQMAYLKTEVLQTTLYCMNTSRLIGNIYYQCLTWSKDDWSFTDSLRASVMVMLLAFVSLRESNSDLFSRMFPSAVASSLSRLSSSPVSCTFSSSSCFSRLVICSCSSGFSWNRVSSNS